MPQEMIEWLQMTATLIIEGDLLKKDGDEISENESPFSCPIQRCPPCPIYDCARPE